MRGGRSGLVFGLHQAVLCLLMGTGKGRTRYLPEDPVPPS